MGWGVFASFNKELQHTALATGGVEAVQANAEGKQRVGGPSDYVLVPSEAKERGAEQAVEADDATSASPQKPQIEPAAEPRQCGRNEVSAPASHTPA